MEEEGSRRKICKGKKDVGGLIMADSVMELKIYNLEDRLAVAQILIKNGYTVSQGKRQRNPAGKALEYFLKVSESPDNADTSK